MPTPLRRLLLLLTLAAAPAYPQAEPLRAGFEQERPLSGTTPAVFTAKLSQGDILHAVITQSGSDVLATLRDPAGQTVFIADANNGAYGPEIIAYIAAAPGEYRLEIRLGAESTARFVRVGSIKGHSKNGGNWNTILIRSSN